MISENFKELIKDSKRKLPELYKRRLECKAWEERFIDRMIRAHHGVLDLAIENGYNYSI